MGYLVAFLMKVLIIANNMYKLYHFPSSHEFYFKNKPTPVDIWKRLQYVEHDDEIYEYVCNKLGIDNPSNKDIKKILENTTIKTLQEFVSCEITRIKIY